MRSSLKKSWRQKMSYLSMPTNTDKIRMERSGRQSKLETRKFKVFNGRRYKQFFSSQARMRGMLSQGSDFVTKTDCSNQVDQDIQSSSPCSMRQRVDMDFGHGCISPQLGCSSPPLNERELVSGFSSEDMDENPRDTDCTNSQPASTQIPSEYTECTICSQGGKLLCCDGQGCNRTFHLACVDPPLGCFPPGVWHCIWCIEKVIRYGVHSISEGIESILDCREVISHDEVTQSQKQYLVKYKGLAHVHGKWIPEREMHHEAPVLLARFKKNKMKGKPDWSLPQRLIQKRLLVFPEPYNDVKGDDGHYSDCRHMWLVKWTGLCYSNATWEFENSSFFKTPEAMNLMRDYETRHQMSHSPKQIERRKLSCLELKEFPFGRSNGLSSSHLHYVNILRGYMYRGQNAVVFDDKERIVKVVLFILSLLDDARQPFLIITPCHVLPLWEAEFNNWASSSSSANIVVYNGNKDVRTSIRHLEFYNEGGCMMFQILLSPPDVVDEDLEMLELINWEAIIVDECQRRQIYVRLKKFKKLAADMRLLLVSCQVKDKRFSYHDALLLLDPEFDGIDGDSLESDSNLDISKLKERFSEFVAFECKSGTSEFAEYWVPVHLSDVQVEQYCASMISSSTSLCCSLKNDSVDCLREILLLNRKCCDHPYLVDPSLQSSLMSDLDVVDHLDVGITVSGKLHLLEKFLLEVNTRGLRVLLLFQSPGGSGSISIGDILDDFIRGRFGEDSYVRVDGEIKLSKKQAALNTFNDKESGNFVCLIDNRACTRIKLSSVDIVIIFDSDWNPINDLRALEKITIDSQFQPLKVFRLYSPFTLEEKSLILAKQGRTLDSNIKNISWSTCHELLKWDAYRLLSRLDESNEYENTLSNDVFGELSALIPNNGDDGDPLNCSIISPVKVNDGTYCRSISVLGEKNEEQLMDNFLANEPSHVFWVNLLEGRKHLCGPSHKSWGKVKYFDGVLEKGSFENKRRKTHNFNLVSPLRRQRNRRKVRRRVEERDPAEIMQRNGVATNTIGARSSKESLSMVQLQILGPQIMQAMRILLPAHQLRICPNNIPDSSSNEPLEPSSATSECLDPIIIGAQKGKEEAIRNHEERKLKLISERDREIAALHKKYDILLQEAELAFVEEKKDLETVYENTHAHKRLADAIAITQAGSPDQEDVISEFMGEIVRQYIQKISTNELLNPSTPANNVVRPKLPMSSSQVPPVMNHQLSSSAAVRPTVRTEKSLEIVPMAGDTSRGAGHPFILEQSAVKLRVMGVPPSPLTIYGSGGRPSFRAPAPHLQHTRPPPYAPTNQPHNLP